MTYLYPMQQVAEGIMFLIKNFFSELSPFWTWEIWPKWKILLIQFDGATPLKPLYRILWNFVVMKDIMCRCVYPYSIFFLGVMPLLEIRNLTKIIDNYSKQFVSTTPLKSLNRISWNFVVIKDIMCRYAFLQEMLIWSF